MLQATEFGRRVVRGARHHRSPRGARADAARPARRSTVTADRDLSSLLDGLRFRDALLILDNCEHLLDAVGHGCGGHRRRRVRARGAGDVARAAGHRRRAGPACAASVTDADGAAVSLFRVRAEEVGRCCSIPFVTARRSCRSAERLDGIPLALELAAARTRSLRPAEIADRLDDMFRLLTGGKRASTERHRTLRADPRVVIRHADALRAAASWPVCRSSPDRSPSPRPRPLPARADRPERRGRGHARPPGVPVASGARRRSG